MWKRFLKPDLGPGLISGIRLAIDSLPGLARWRLFLGKFNLIGRKREADDSLSHRVFIFSTLHFIFILGMAKAWDSNELLTIQMATYFRICLFWICFFIKGSSIKKLNVDLNKLNDFKNNNPDLFYKKETHIKWQKFSKDFKLYV